MVKTKKIVSIDRFELSEKDKAEIKANLPRLAKLFVKYGNSFDSPMDSNVDGFINNELKLNSFKEMLEAYNNWGECDDDIYSMDGFNDCCIELDRKSTRLNSSHL